MRYRLLRYNHDFSVAGVGRALAINPGPIVDARFSTGKWEDGLATVAAQVFPSGGRMAGENVCPTAFELRTIVMPWNWMENNSA
jgi:hypothetical protein